MKKNRTNKIDGVFVPLLISTLDAPAWRAMSHGAQLLYVALKRRYNQNNNGNIFLSERAAAAELHSHRDYVRRWYRELQHYGFIVQMQAGHLGVEGKGKAAHWRLTELRHRGEPPTKDFLRWKGTPFTASEKTESRPTKGSTLAHNCGPLLAHKSGPPSGKSPAKPPIRVAHKSGPYLE